MQVVHSKAVEVLSHFPDVVGHVFPRLRCICWAFSVADPQKIAPNVYSSSQVIVFLGQYEEFAGVSSSDPAVVDGVKFLILSDYFGEAFVDKRIRVIEGAVVVIKVDIFDTADGVL